MKSNSARSTISAHTKRIIQYKNALRRRWQRLGPGIDKQRAKRDLNEIKMYISQTVTAEYNNFIANQLRHIKKGSKKLWKLSKSARGKNICHTDKIKIHGMASVDDNDNANCLAKIFGKSHTITNSFTHENDINVSNTINAFNNFSHLRCPSPRIERNEIYNIINSFRPFKSPGPDTIQNILLKKLPSAAIDWITVLINKCVEKCHWPSNFKTAKVIPILKSGKPAADPNSYRPISLLNALGKVLERIVYSRLIDIVELKNLLPDFQFGFRKGHSTIHQAKRIHKYISRNKAAKKSTGVVLLDIEKAFDSVWHDGLIHKLIKMKIPSYLIRLINAFIRNRHFSVYVNNNISNKIKIPAGLAQGTCISPILYALFVADIPTDPSTKIALYADDTAIYSSSKQTNTIVNRLNSSLASLQNYFNKWRIKLNSSKTQAIIFPFDNKRRRKEHVNSTLLKTNKCFRALYSMLSKKAQLSTSNKTLIYIAVIRPILAYGAPIWSSAARTHIQKLNNVQNKITKTINNLPRRTPTFMLERLTNIQSLNEYLDSLNTKFIQNCHTSDYELIREIER